MMLETQLLVQTSGTQLCVDIISFPIFPNRLQGDQKRCFSYVCISNCQENDRYSIYVNQLGIFKLKILHKEYLLKLNAKNCKILPREMEFYQKDIWTFVLFFIAIVTTYFLACPYNIHQFSSLLFLKIGRKHTVHLERKENNKYSIKYHLK